MKRKNRVGEVTKTKESLGGYEIKIVEDKGSHDLIIEFQDEYKTKVKIQYTQFQKGNVKNPYHPSVFNIGYIGEGKYKTSVNKRKTLAYSYWFSMLQRCYDPYFLNKEPTYIDIFVCDEWHNFQNFAEWFYKNYYEINNEKICLDKDILAKGNKIYSPKTCCFIPQIINGLFIKNNRRRGDIPIGVSQKCENGGYQCTCGIGNNSSVYLSTFSTKRNAWLMYKINKELVIQSIANEYKDKIPQYVYEAMMNYRVEYDD